MAVATDNQLKTKFDSNQQGFALLSKTRQELAAMIPQSADAGQIDQNPAVAAVKDQLNQLEDIRKGKENVMNEGVAMQDQLNAVE